MSQFESVNDYISFMKAHPNMTCPIKHTLDIIGGKWKLFIVLQLFGSEQLRFSQLSKNIPGITNTVLSGCLRDMEKDGIILRHQFNEIPPHVEYSLTETGRSLMPVLVAMRDWGADYLRRKNTEPCCFMMGTNPIVKPTNR